MVMVRPSAPLGRELAQRGEDELRFLDRVDGAAVAPVRLADPGVARPARNGDHRHEAAPARDPGVEPGRLRDDSGVSANAAGDRSEPADASGLLVRDRADHEVAGEAKAERGEDLGGEGHRRDAALHVARPAPVEPTVADLGLIGIARPALAWLAGDDVHVAVHEQAPAASAPGEAGRELRPALEVDVGRREARSGDVSGRRFPEIHLGACCTQAGGEILLEGSLVPRGRTRLARRRVETDEVSGERDNVVRALLDLVDCAALVSGQAHARARASTLRRAASTTSGGAAPGPSSS